MMGLKTGDEFHFVTTTSRPPLSNQVLKSRRWVVFPEPSIPSNAINRPGSWFLSGINSLDGDERFMNFTVQLDCRSSIRIAKTCKRQETGFYQIGLKVF